MWSFSVGWLNVKANLLMKRRPFCHNVQHCFKLRKSAFEQFDKKATARLFQKFPTVECIVQNSMKLIHIFPQLKVNTGISVWQKLHNISKFHVIKMIVKTVFLCIFEFYTTFYCQILTKTANVISLNHFSKNTSSLILLVIC